MAQRLIIQHLIMPKESTCAEEKLYYRDNFSYDEFLSFPISMNSNNLLGFETFFNSVSIEKWNHYTKLNNISLTLVLKGKFELSLVQIYLENSTKGAALNQTILSRHRIDSEYEKEISFSFKDYSNNGLLTFRIKALADNCIVSNGYYETEIKSNISNVRLALGICTYKREQFIQRTINIIKESLANGKCLSDTNSLEVFLVDNAKSLKAEDYNYPWLHFFQQKDVGASGGFSRAMIEVNLANEKGAGFSHVIIMDDDIVFEAESIYRTYAFLTMLKEEYKDASIGGSMLDINKKHMLYESGGIWKAEGLRPFSTINRNIDMRNIRGVVESELSTEANWQGWYYCAVPLSICTLENLVYPMIMKLDDIEYGARAIKTLIFLNGINVWHESGTTKYSSENVYYYWPRNYMMFAAIHQPSLSKSDYVSYIKAMAIRLMTNHSYQEMKLLYKAVIDFLGGITRIKEIDPASYHEGLVHMGYKLKSVSEFPTFSKSLYRQTKERKYPKNRLKRLFWILTVNGLLLPSDKTVVVDIVGGTKTQTSGAKNIIRYVPQAEKAFMCKRSIGNFIYCAMLYIGMINRLKLHIDEVIRDYQDHYSELTNVTYWNTKF